jgi:HlyD family secretion protein
VPAGNPHASPFRPGMSATVDIQTRRAKDALTVPIQAVTTRDTTVRSSSKAVRGRDREGEERAPVNKASAEEETVTECVFVLDDGAVRQRVVTSGIQDNEFIEIKTGLKEGEEVVTGPYSAISRKLKDGDAVKVVDQEKIFSKE